MILKKERKRIKIHHLPRSVTFLHCWKTNFLTPEEPLPVAALSVDAKSPQEQSQLPA
jgi:hypothetical protein